MRRVITYGTYDLFHQGHYNILKRAKEQGDYLIVGVTSESFDLERGKLNVRDSLLKRIENVRKTGFADEIIIEEYQGQKLSDILKYKIDCLVLGSDWRGKFDYLKQYCDVVYLERTKNISSTQLRNEGKTYRIGVITDVDTDGGIVWESKYVSGLHTESVFSESEEQAKVFCTRYELDSYWTDLPAFLSGVDMVFVHVKEAKRYDYAKAALLEGKYVICDTPVSSSPEGLRELMALAQEKGVMLLESIPMVYLRAFNQLVWQVNEGLVGKVLLVECSISGDDYAAGTLSLSDPLSSALCCVIKFLGKDYLDMRVERVGEGEARLDIITFRYADAVAFLKVSKGLEVPPSFRILGTGGTIIVPQDWWNTGYFEAKLGDADQLKRFCFNFEGNGLRYLLQEMMIMISDGRTDNARLFPDEALTVSSLEEEIYHTRT